MRLASSGSHTLGRLGQRSICNLCRRESPIGTRRVPDRDGVLYRTPLLVSLTQFVENRLELRRGELQVAQSTLGALQRVESPLNLGMPHPDGRGPHRKVGRDGRRALHVNDTRSPHSAASKKETTREKDVTDVRESQRVCN